MPHLAQALDLRVSTIDQQLTDVWSGRYRMAGRCDCLAGARRIGAGNKRATPPLAPLALLAPRSPPLAPARPRSAPLGQGLTESHEIAKIKRK